MQNDKPLTEPEREAIAEYMNVDVGRVREDENKDVFICEHVNGRTVHSYVPYSAIRYALLESWA